MRVTIKGKFNETNHFLSSGVDEVVIIIIHFTHATSIRDFQELQSFNISSISRSKASSSGVRGLRVPKFEFVIIIDSQQEIFLDILLHFRIPDAGRRVGFVLNSEAIFNWELIEQLGLRHRVLEAFSIHTYGEKAGLKVVIFVIVLTEG
jgi:hypothetical protein